MVNDRLRTTTLASTIDSNEYYFGSLRLPNNFVVESVSAAIKIYFNASIDILKNMDRSLDKNKAPALINSVLVTWEANFSEVAGWINQKGELTCAPSEIQGTETSLPLGQCTFSKYNTGFWDMRKHNFIPVECYFPEPTWPPPLEKRSGHTWIHLLGDSNMNKLQTALCGKIQSKKKFKGERSHKNVVWRACISQDGALALVFSVSWMGGNAAAGMHIRPFVLGQPMSNFLCGAGAIPTASPELCAAWNVVAHRTVIAPGSHNPEQLIPRANADVRSWIDDIAGRMPRPESLILALTVGVCLRHFNPRSSPQLFQRNNYRLRPVNDAVVEVAAERGLPVLDLWSVSLAAGCNEESGDAVHFRGPVYGVSNMLLMIALSSDLPPP